MHRRAGLDRRPEEPEEAAARDVLRSEARQMLGLDLAIDEQAAGVEERPGQGGEGRLRGIGAPGEHALAEEDAAQRNPVQAADELAIPPGLDRVRVPQPVQRQVGGVHRGGDPRPVLPGARRRGAGREHLRERGVGANVVGPPAEHFLQAGGRRAARRAAARTADPGSARGWAAPPSTRGRCRGGTPPGDGRGRDPPTARSPERSARSGGGKASGSCPRRNTVTRRYPGTSCSIHLAACPPRRGPPISIAPSAP